MTSFHRAVRRVASLLLAASLLGAIDAGAQSPVADFGHFDSFPEVVGPYHRREVMSYAPDMSDFSIGYNSRTPELDSTVTLYFYPQHHPNEREQLQDEERQVLGAHEGARVLARRRVTLVHGTTSHEATLVTFALRMPRGGREQESASQLLLVFRDRGIFMVRSTGPQEQGEVAEAAMLELVRSVDWESIPGR